MLELEITLLILLFAVALVDIIAMGGGGGGLIVAEFGIGCHLFVCAYDEMCQ